MTAIFSQTRLPRLICRTLAPHTTVQLAPWKRYARSQAYDADFDPAELAEAKKWRETTSAASLPKGSTSFARSSGPGGQHVNKTESKAITSWTVAELTRSLPKLLQPLLRSSKHYVKNKDSLLFHAQDSRDRNANAEENRNKLLQELQSLYSKAVPGDTSEETKQKHVALAKAFTQSRLKAKKFQSSKKAARKGEY